MILEVCVDSVESARNAVAGGAARLELCCCLGVGGVTPSVGLLRRIKEVVVDVPVFPLIRTRDADFLYSSDDLIVMQNDIGTLKEAGADGIVVGALTSDGLVDVPSMTSLISIAKPLPVTFHRAIDMCRDPLDALHTVVALGCQRVLTSGQNSNAWEGRHLLQQMVDEVKDQIIIMPGGGITVENLRGIVEATGASEFHASAKVLRESEMKFLNRAVNMGTIGEEYHTYVCDSTTVGKMVSILGD